MNTTNIYRPKEIVIYGVVWGNEYIDFFLNYCLTSQNTEGNFKFLARNFDTELVIYTHSNHFDQITNSRIYKELSEYLKIKLIDYSKVIEENYISLTNSILAYKIMSSADRDIIHYYHQKPNAALLALCVDTYLANNFWQEVIAIALSGKRVVFVPHLSMLKDSGLEEINKIRDQGKEVEPQQLIDIGIRNLHSIYDPSLKTTDRMHTWGEMMWKLSPDCIMYKSVHHHPIYTFPVNRSIISLFRTLDTSAYPFECCPDRNLYGYIDAKQSIIFELSRPNISRIGEPWVRSLIFRAYLLKQGGHPKRIKEFEKQTNYFISSTHKTNYAFIKNKIKAHIYSKTLFFIMKLPNFLMKPLLYKGFYFSHKIKKNTLKDKISCFLLYLRHFELEVYYKHYLRELNCQLSADEVIKWISSNPIKISDTIFLLKNYYLENRDQKEIIKLINFIKKSKYSQKLMTYCYRELVLAKDLNNLSYFKNLESNTKFFQEGLLRGFFAFYEQYPSIKSLDYLEQIYEMCDPVIFKHYLRKVKFAKKFNTFAITLIKDCFKQNHHDTNSTENFLALKRLIGFIKRNISSPNQMMYYYREITLSGGVHHLPYFRDIESNSEIFEEGLIRGFFAFCEHFPNIESLDYLEKVYEMCDPNLFKRFLNKNKFTKILDDFAKKSIRKLIGDQNVNQTEKFLALKHLIEFMEKISPISNNVMYYYREIVLAKDLSSLLHFKNIESNSKIFQEGLIRGFFAFCDRSPGIESIDYLSKIYEMCDTSLLKRYLSRRKFIKKLKVFAKNSIQILSKSK